MMSRIVTVLRQLVEPTNGREATAEGRKELKPDLKLFHLTDCKVDVLQTYCTGICHVALSRQTHVKLVALFPKILPELRSNEMQSLLWELGLLNKLIPLVLSVIRKCYFTHLRMERNAAKKMHFFEAHLNAILN